MKTMKHNSIQRRFFQTEQVVWVVANKFLPVLAFSSHHSHGSQKTNQTNKEGMKLKVLFATLLGTFLLQHAAFAQTNADTTNLPVVVADASATNTPAMTNAAVATPATGGSE